MANDRVKIRSQETLSLQKYALKNIYFDYQTYKGEWMKQKREVYDRGNGATALLYDSKRRKVVLTRQFRLPPYLNGHENGFLQETCAGVVDEGEDSVSCMKREILEETGYEVLKLERIFEVYMSPASVTEKISFYMAEYGPHMKKDKGGGREDEQEDIEVLEVDYDHVVSDLINNRIIDAKTLILIQYAKLKGIFD